MIPINIPTNQQVFFLELGDTKFTWKNKHSRKLRQHWEKKLYDEGISATTY